MPILQTAAELTVSSEGTCTWTSVHCTAIVKPCVCSRIRRLCMNSRADQNDWREILSRLVAGPISHFPRIAVLAAHPDDETIGASVLLARSNDPLVIYLTDGAPLDSKLWSTDFHGSRTDYASMRREE